jgi:hypothetical protein
VYENFDANKILHHQIKWTDLKLKDEITEKEEEDEENLRMVEGSFYNDVASDEQVQEDELSDDLECEDDCEDGQHVELQTK